MRTTHTFYHDPEQQILHHVMCKVDDAGNHTVTESAIRDTSTMHVPAVVRAVANRIGRDNVRAYTITPMKDV